MPGRKTVALIVPAGRFMPGGKTVALIEGFAPGRKTSAGERQRLSTVLARHQRQVLSPVLVLYQDTDPRCCRGKDITGWM